jgi:hypothetical protein
VKEKVKPAEILYTSNEECGKRPCHVQVSMIGKISLLKVKGKKGKAIPVTGHGGPKG